MGLSMAERRGVTREMAIRYTRITKRERGVMVSELCALTGWTRRHARRRLSQIPLTGSPPQRRTPVRPRTYDDEVIAILRKLWAMMGGPCGKRLAPFLPELVAALERHGELTLDPYVRARLITMSAATIDRALVVERRKLRIKGRSGTKPGSMLKNQIPIRTFSQWDENQPGFLEIDLVGHEGGNSSGEFCQTLDATDVCSGWTEMRVVRNKAQRWVHEALVDITSALPFPLKGIDSDNGSEFINDHLFRWCAKHRVTFTRARSGRKNDNCFIEQKNWTHVRHAVGYARYDTSAEMKILAELYAVWSQQLNFFGPQMRLASKTREGSKVTRRYDTAATPYRRLLTSEHLDAASKDALTLRYESLNPAALSREIARLQRRLLEVTARKARTRKAQADKLARTAPTEPRERTAPRSATRTPKAAPSDAPGAARGKGRAPTTRPSPGRSEQTRTRRARDPGPTTTRGEVSTPPRPATRTSLVRQRRDATRTY